MILIMLALLCVLALFLLVGLYTRRRIALNTVVTIVVMCVLFLPAAKLTMRVMLPTFADRVTIEVTGEKNPESKGTDIGITSIRTGSKILNLNGSDVDRGTWSYNGTALSWSYTANRTVTFLAPCYTDTKIEFIRNEWAGRVRLLWRNSEEILDLYAPNSSDTERVTHTIPHAERSEIVVRMLPTAFALLFEFLLFFALGFFWAKKKADAARRLVWKWGEWNKKLSPYFWLRLLVVLAAFLTMWRFAGRWSLWSDDLATISFVAENVPLSTNIARTLDEAPSNPPLFYILAYFWLRIMPYGTAYLKLLSILFCCAGIWFCGVAAKRIAGDRAALIAAVFAATSVFLIRQAAYTFRSFGLMFLLCALLIISYHKRLTEQEKACHYISYGLLHALLLYTNYICGLITAILGLYDLWLFARKKINLRFLWSYIGAGLAFLPLILHVLSDMVASHANFWPSVPDLSELRRVILLVFGNHIFLLALFLLAAVLACAAALRVLDVKGEEAGTYVEIALVLWPLFVVGFVYIFSRYLYPSASFFVDRYFISVLAPAVIVAAVGMDRVLEALCEGRERAASEIITCAAILICYVFLEYSCLKEVRANPGPNNECYEQAIDWICAQEDAYQEDCIVVMSGYSEGGYYYATQGGKRPNLNFGSLNEENWADYDVVYVAPLHYGISSGSQALLNAHYEEVERWDNIRVVKYSKIS